MSEEAKAAQEIAKASCKAIDAASDLGKFGKQVFGDLLVNGVGILSDRLKFYRLERAILLEEKVQAILKKRNIEQTTAVPPKIGLPLIEQATLEEEDSLHTKWANMLANAMDPNCKDKIKRSFVSILADMEPSDVLILDSLVKTTLEFGNANKEKKASRYKGTSTLKNFISEQYGIEMYGAMQSRPLNEPLFSKENIASKLKIDLDECELSLRNLIRLGCLKPGIIEHTSMNIGGEHPTIFLDTTFVSITALGISLHIAVN